MSKGRITKVNMLNHVHPTRIVGKSSVTLRSSYENKFYDFVCRNIKHGNVDVLVEENLLKPIDKVGVESFIVPYKLQGETKVRRYFMDFYLELSVYDNVTGETIKEIQLVEIKPNKERQDVLRLENNVQIPKPRVTKRSNKERQQQQYLKRVETANMNRQKWNQAKKLCESKSTPYCKWSFKVLTEIELNLNVGDNKKR